eukprot:CAMPEP_0184706754 /NCGR_PEP_ID=MMETSP0313-20130426/36920_1 /TAXON_ID=2792 /ORGANISM="Porphyridium aerugineum, Strain SAG 1380-2" /LENGTH=258 /DNA_ID=CAMNT_0027168315 /DNA_START=35 /DNA_END=811 /DNA_ORIENTATION=-
MNPAFVSISGGSWPRQAGDSKRNRLVTTKWSSRKSCVCQVQAIPDVSERTDEEWKQIYEEIDRNPVNAMLMKLFQSKMEEEMNMKATKQGFEAITELALLMGRKRGSSRDAIEQASYNVLASLFPEFLPPAFRAMFASPFPDFSTRMNAYVTSLATLWLMGPNRMEDNGLTVHVEKCRYLEGTHCVSSCTNSCKRPTQRFFKEALNIDLNMEPNYDDYSCKFKFGQLPPPESEDKAFQVGCLARCDIKRSELSKCPKV